MFYNLRNWTLEILLIHSYCKNISEFHIKSEFAWFGRLSLTNEKEFMNRFMCVGEFFDGF